MTFKNIRPLSIFLFIVLIVVISTLTYINKNKPVDCTQKGVQIESDYLRFKGYREAADGSWKNAKGDYPSSNISNEAEKFLNFIYNDCLQNNSSSN